MAQEKKKLWWVHNTEEGCRGVFVNHDIYLTSDKTIFVTGRCYECGASLQVEKTLKELAEQCPSPPPTLAEEASQVPPMTDPEFLRKFKIDPASWNEGK